MFSRKTKMYRQGDVLIEPLDEVLGDTEAVPLDAGRVVLAYGEATGHAHAIAGPDVGFVAHMRAKGAADGSVTYLDIARPVALRHEEHAPITLPKGKYRVVRQREWDDEQERRVAD